MNLEARFARICSYFVMNRHGYIVLYYCILTILCEMCRKRAQTGGKWTENDDPDENRPNDSLSIHSATQ